MDSNFFLTLLKNPGKISESDYLQVKQLQANFPYFHLAHGIAAKYEFEKNEKTQGSSLAMAALTSPDRIRLKRWIELPVEIQYPSLDSSDSLLEISGDEMSVNFDAKIDQAVQNEQIILSTREENFPITKKKKRSPPKDDLIESIKMREKKEIVDSKKQEQIDLIKEFNKKDFKLAAIREIESNQPTENLAESSTQFNDNLVSETFARILIRQGKKEMAAEIYGKMALKFPDKRAYFADLIEKLKE